MNLEASLSSTQSDLVDAQSELSIQKLFLCYTTIYQIPNKVSTQDALSSTELDLASANTTIDGLNADLALANSSMVNLEASLSSLNLI